MGGAPAGTGPGAGEPPAPAPPDERVLAAGTTMRFVLLLLLLATAGASMVPRTVWQFLASSAKADKGAGCWLAAGIDPGASLNTGYVQYTRSASAFKECVARYGQDFDGVSLGVGAVAVAAAVAVYWLLPVWRTRRGKVVPLDAMDVHGELRPLVDELVAVAGLGRPPRFVVDPAASTDGAVAFGRRRRPAVRLDGGLVATSGAQRDRFRAVVLHELAHLHNRDTGITYATVALWWVFLVLVLLPWAAAGLDVLLFAGTPDARGQSAPFNTHNEIFGVLIVLAVHLTRAGILRNREIYADLMAARWGAGSEPWEVRAPQPAGVWRRLPTGFAGLWRTHPSWALRHASLTDPKALFALDGLSLFLTGVAADILAWFLGGVLPYGALPARGLLVAGLLVGIGGVALWRAVLYALLGGRPAPSGASVGLWLGSGVVVAELTGPAAAYNHWLPAHPEALLILVAGLVLVMTWTGQNAAWWLGSRRGRSPGAAMLVGLAVPSLALASLLYWWYYQGEVLTDGWPFTTSGLLGSYGLPGLPPAHIGPLLKAVAVVGVLPGTDASAESLWWAGVPLWLLPLLVLAARPPVRRPGRLAGARPETAAPHPPGPGRLLAAGLAGGLLCWAGLALALAHMHTPDPAAVRMTGPFQLAHLMWPVLVTCGAMALTAAVVAAVTDSGWLLSGLIAAGLAALLGAGGTYLLMSTDGCLGPLDTMTDTCRWWPDVAWPLVRIELAYTLTLGTLVAGLSAFAGRGAGLLLRRPGRSGEHPARPTARRPLRPVRRRGARIAVVAVVVAGLGTTVLTVQGAGSPARSSRSPDSMLDRSTPAPSASTARIEGQAWAAVGGLDDIEALSAADRDYATAFEAVVRSTSDAQFATAMGKLGNTCAGLARATKRAGAYFTVPDPAGQQVWSDVLTRHRKSATACRNLTARPGSATARTAVTAHQAAADSADAMLYWLAETGAIRPASPRRSRERPVRDSSSG